MKSMFDNNGDEVTLYDLCSLIYQGFGQFGVHDFVNALEHLLPQVSWSECKECEIESPIENKTCLVCGSGVE